MKTIDLLWFLTVVGLTNCAEGAVRLVVMAGSDVVLPCSLDNKDIESTRFEWMKDGRQDVFVYDAGIDSVEDKQFKGRVSHFPDELRNGKASIIIRNTRLSDSGNYTCYFPRIQQQRFHIELLVAATTMQVKEDDDAILNCFLGTGNIKEEVFDWKKDKDNDKEKKEVFLYAKGSYYGYYGQAGQDPQFVGRVFHFPDQLQFGNASIVIRKTKTSDSGTYTCLFPNHQPEIRSSISLTVDPILKPRPWIEGAAPEPSVTMLHQNKKSALLQCEVRGASPKPEVVWKDSDGKILPADELKITEREKNKYDVVLHITVTKTDRYTCVTTQKEINHRVHSEAFVGFFNCAASEPSVTILGETNDGVLLQCIVRGASPELKVSWKDRAGKLVPSKEPQRTEKGGSYDIILQTTVTKTDYYRCVTTEENVDDELYSEILVPVPDGTSGGSNAGLIIALVVAVAIILALIGVLYVRSHNR